MKHQVLVSLYAPTVFQLCIATIYCEIRGPQGSKFYKHVVVFKQAFKQKLFTAYIYLNLLNTLQFSYYMVKMAYTALDKTDIKINIFFKFLLKRKCYWYY